MNIKKITDGVIYTGVNDRDTVKFENLWPIPHGVSYNSYLVKGSDKTAIIDTVETSSSHRYITVIKSALAESEPDYLIVNHMEPDHSGSIPELVCHFPSIKVVGNKQTLAMIKGYYGIDDSRFMEIKDGDEINLGDKTLKFVLTPMVHWPETMVTYLKEDKMLFSGDAFGTFGALNGGVIDEGIDTSIYFDEMYRYYSNIVGKYGKFVQKALDKLKGIDIEYICPTHGPVWHSKIKEVSEIYNRLSLYQNEPGVTIVYGTMYGNTQDMVEAIASRLSERGIKNIRIHNASKSDMSYIISDAFRFEGLIVGSPTYCMKLFPPVEEFMIAMETREVKNKVLATFGAYTWSPCVNAKLKEFSARMDMPILTSLDMKQSFSETTQEEAIALADKVYEALKMK